MFLLNASAWHPEPGVRHRLSSGRQNPNAISSEKQPEPLFGQGWQSILLWAALLHLSSACLMMPPSFLFSFSLTCRAGRSKAREPSTQWSMPAGTRYSSEQEGCVCRRRCCGRNKAEAACASLTPPWCKSGRELSQGGGVRVRDSAL